MKHAEIIVESDKNNAQKDVEVKVADGKTVYLIEQEYTEAELDAFNVEKEKWIIQRSGVKNFLADHDSGEDATGYYCGYFDLVPSNAVFENGEPVGYYICPDDIDYDGNGRSSFEIKNWRHPGYNPFDLEWRRIRIETHVFLFSETATHKWKEWDLLIRNPEERYKSYLHF